MDEILKDSIYYRISSKGDFGVKYNLTPDGFEVSLVDVSGEISANRHFYDFITSVKFFEKLCIYCVRNQFEETYNILVH